MLTGLLEALGTDGAADADSVGVLTALHDLHVFLMRLCSKMHRLGVDSPHCLHSLLWQLSSQMLDPPHLLAPASWAIVLADALPRTAASLATASSSCRIHNPLLL